VHDLSTVVREDDEYEESSRNVIDGTTKKSVAMIWLV
jgi:hypothetical protein